MFALVLRETKPNLCASSNRGPGTASASRMAEGDRCNLPSLLVVLSHREIDFLIPWGALGGRSAREIGCFRVAKSICILDWLILNLPAYL